MALALFDRVQETTTTTGTGAVTLDGAVPGYQSFAVVGNANTCYYTIVDGVAWEVGVGTYSTSGPTLARTTVLSNSNGNTSPITLAVGTKIVFLTYPASKSVNLNESGNVSPLGTVVSGIWNGTTIGVAYGGTGVTASSGANSVVLRDSNQNVAVNRVNQANTNTTAAGGTTALTAASSYIHTLVGTGGQTYTLPDATTLTTGVAFVFNNLATSTLTVANYAGTTIGTIPSGGAGAVFLTLNSTVGGTWDLHAYLPEGVTFGTNAFNLGTSIISGGTWQGGTIQTGYGGTGLTSYTSGGAVYANSSSTLTSGTLPVTAGGTGNTSGQAASTASSATFNSGGAGDASGTTFNGSAARTISYNTIGAPSTTGTNASGTWGISISGNSATTSQRAFSGDISTTGQGRFTGWYTGNAATGPATEVGLAGGEGYILSYNRSTSAYVPLNIAASAANMQFSGSTINVTSGSLQQGGSQVLTAANYNSYAPTLTGGGASGTWGINITGSAGSAPGYLPLSGGTMTGNILVSSTSVGAQFGNLSVGYGGAYNTLQTKDGSSELYLQASSTGNINIGPGGGYTTIYQSTRSPIFYDSNNTGFYVDPASGSNLAGTITMNGGKLLVLSDSGGYGQVQINSSNTSTEATLLFGSGGSGQNSGGYTYAGVIGLGAYGLSKANLYFGAGYSAPSMFIPNSSAYVEAINSFRAPLFYDSNNTGFYVDPASTSVLSALRLTSDNALFIVAPNGAYQRVDTRNDSTASRAHWYGVLTDGNTSNFRHAWYDGSAYFNVTAASGAITFSRVGGGGNVTTDESFRAPIFYDSNDTAYYTDPSYTSSMFGVAIRGDQASTGTANQIFFWSSGNTTTSAIGFKANGGSFPNPTGFGDGYNTYLTMDTDGRGWVFRRGVGGSDFSAAYTSGWILNNGVWQANASMRAPIFYDSNDTGFYLDPASTTYLNITYLASGKIFTSNNGSGNSIEWYVRPDGNDTYVWRHIYGGSGTGFGTGVGGYGVYCQHLGGNYSAIYSPSGFVTFPYSARSPIFYDSDDTSFYVDPANGGFNLRGGTSNRVTYVTNDSGIKIVNPEGNGVSDTRLGAAYGLPGVYVSTSLYLQSEANVVFRINNSERGYIDASANLFAYGSMRSPIFYDSNDTTYYVNPNSVSNLYNLTIGNYIQTQSYPGILICGNTGYNYNFLNGSWTGSITAGILANCADQWEFAIHDSGERVISPFIFFGGAGSNYILMGRDIGWGATYIQAASSFRAPIFYDSNDTAYYCDPNGTSRLNAINANSINTNAVLSGTAGAGAAEVGTYGLMRSYSYGNSYVVGQTIGGGSLNFSAAGGAGTGTGAGTWRCMGYSGAPGSGNYQDITLWLRIS